MATIEKVCEICGATFKVPHWREKARFCSRECAHKALKAEPNLVCPNCGKAFHRKPHHIARFKGDYGFYCSRECAKMGRSQRMQGENNHQYGLKGILNASFKQGITSKRNNKLIDEMIYVGEWYKNKNENGRVKLHRYLVEENHALFPSFFFEEKDGWYYLKDGVEVHHIDGNHNHNELSNLRIMTKAEHTSCHNKKRVQPRNEKGQFIKSNIN